MELNITYTIDEIPMVVDKLLPLIRSNKLVLLRGDLGTGKTTLSKEIFRALGVESSITSPTYSLVNEYTTKDGVLLYHLDLYRIEDAEELFEIGIEDYLNPPVLSIIEWPEIAMDMIEAPFLSMEIDYESLDKRRVKVEEMFNR